MYSSNAGGVTDGDTTVKVKLLEVCKGVQTWSRKKEM